MSSMRIRVSTIVYFLIFVVTFLTIPYLENYNTIKYIFLLLAGVYCIRYIKAIFNEKKFLITNVLVTTTAIWVIGSAAFLNGNVERNTFLAAIVYYGALLEMVYIIEISIIKNDFDRFLKVILILFGLAVAIVDTQVIVELFLGMGHDFKTYIFGIKFNVGILNVQYIVFYWMYMERFKKLKRSRIIALALLEITVSWLAYTSTLVVIGVILLLGFIFEDKLKKVITNPAFFVVIYILSATFIYWYPILLKSRPIVELSNYMGENISDMSGRTTVFKMIPIICSSHLWTGYGYGTSYEVIWGRIRVADAQNGFWELMVNIGLVGALLYTVTLALPYFQARKKRETFPLYFYITIIVLLACVEVPYGNSLLFFAFIAMYINQDKSCDLETGESSIMR